jgi:hypothetical protein
MRRLGIAGGLLGVLALAALWFGPRAMDWEPWRERLAELATDRLGRPVTLDGPVELVVLPSPMIRAGGVTIAAPPGYEDDESFRVTARALRLRLGLGALVAGRVAPREIALIGAEMTLPWPPGPVLAFRPPSWITELDARVEDSTVRLGAAVLENVSAQLTSISATQALEITGAFTVAGRAARFGATLGRPGWDGIAPVEVSLALPEASARARGVMVPEGGFDGTLEVSGPDLSALLPSPVTTFRAAGRLTARADLLAADDLSIELGGAPARGAAALRLVPTPRLDVALLASRVELDGWVAALRQGGPRPWPVSVDLSAEAATYAGVTLRRLRGAAFLEEGRLTLTDVSMLLQGETELEFAGATAGGRLELGARFAGPDIRATLAALGLPVEDMDPTLLRRGEGRFRLVLEEAQAAVPEFTAAFEDLRLSGAGTLRHGARPALGLGLTVDRFDLGRWLPKGIDLAQLGMRLAGFDLNIRLAANQARAGEVVLERAALDAAVESGRLSVRRLSGKLAESDIVAAGGATLAQPLRVHDLSIEASGPSGRGLLALIPGAWPDGSALAGMPMALRVTGGGPAEALALRVEGHLGELRAEASLTLDAPGGRATATTTLRHPGAPRLLSEAFGLDVGAWLGEGSFSLVANVAAGPQGASAENFELVAGGLRAGGGLALATGARPRVTGRVVAERLPLPMPGLRSAEPLGLEALAGFDGELALEAAMVEAGVLAGEGVSAMLRLADGRLAVERLRARVAGGTLEGAMALDVSGGGLPRLGAELRLAQATLAGPLLGLPYDLTAGRGDASARVTAAGHSAAALLGTLAGTWQVRLADGVLTGLDLAGATAATAVGDLAEAEPAVRRALSGGATAFDRLELQGVVEGGRLRIEAGRVATEPGATATLTGEADLPRGVLDLRVGARAATPEAPELGLRVTGPVEAPRALPETAAWARWRAERG